MRFGCPTTIEMQKLVLTVPSLFGYPIFPLSFPNIFKNQIMCTVMRTAVTFISSISNVQPFPTYLLNFNWPFF